MAGAWEEDVMVSVESPGISVPQHGTGMIDMGDNKHYVKEHLIDHTYFVLPVDMKRTTDHIGQYEQSSQAPILPNVFPSMPSSLSQEASDPERRRFYYPTIGISGGTDLPNDGRNIPPISSTSQVPEFNQLKNDIVTDTVVVGNKYTMEKLMDYTDAICKLKDESPAGSSFACQEGVMLTKQLELEAPGNYRENYCYNVLQKLGEGTFGSVTRCVDIKKKTHFACKRVTLESFRRQEVEVLVQLMDSTRGARCLPEIYAVLLDDNFVKILMEFVDMSWLDFVKTHVGMNCHIEETVILELLKQALHGLKHLQTHKIVHCDIKPDNIGYNREGKVKLLDFGTVRLPNEEFTHRGMTGHYMAPEACCRVSHFNSDTWSLACSVLYLITRTHPWWHVSKNQGKVIQYIKEKPSEILEFVKFPELTGKISNMLADLLRQMLRANPDERLTAEKALQHYVFKHFGESGSTPINSLTHMDSVEVPTVVPTQESDSNLQIEASELFPNNQQMAPNQLYQGANTVPVMQYNQLQQPYASYSQFYVPQTQNDSNVVQRNDIAPQQILLKENIGLSCNPGDINQHNHYNYGAPIAASNLTYCAVNQLAGLNTVQNGASNQPHGSNTDFYPPNHNWQTQNISHVAAGYQQHMPHTNPVMAQTHQRINPRGFTNNESYMGLNQQDPLADRLANAERCGQLELPLDLSQHVMVDKVDGESYTEGYNYRHGAGDMVMSIGDQLAATSGYSSSAANHMDVSIEVTLEERVDQFRAPSHCTIGDIWPTLKDKARKLVSRSNRKEAVALFEEKRKLDTSHFSEVLERDRRFTVQLMTE